MKDERNAESNLRNLWFRSSCARRFGRLLKTAHFCPLAPNEKRGRPVVPGDRVISGRLKWAGG